MNSSEDRIVRETMIKAPLDRVWRALANAEEFGDWFGAELKGQTFAAGHRAQGHITYPGYEHLVFDVLVEQMVPKRQLSFRWHPYAVDPAVDYGQEPMTLVVFTIHTVANGTLLRLVESGFDAIPAQRRQEAFRMHSSGWDEQMTNIEKHVMTQGNEAEIIEKLAEEAEISLTGDNLKKDLKARRNIMKQTFYNGSHQLRHLTPRGKHI